MRKSIRLAILVLIGTMIGFSGSALAQKKHAPKSLWTTMIASLTDLQTMTGALMVFDLKRASSVAGSLADRETFISKIKALPAKVRKGHAKVAEQAKKLQAAIETGEEKQIAAGLGNVMAACSTCHQNVRDAGRLKKMK